MPAQRRRESGTSSSRGSDLARKDDVDLLIADLVAEPWGQVSPSVYETGRLVSLAPWLIGHSERVVFLVGSQLPSGRWHGPDQYAVVPTLSATEALLATVLRADREASITRRTLVAAVNRGLRALFSWFHDRIAFSFPDTPAIELIVPTLVISVNNQLDQLQNAPVVGLGRWRGSARLRLPDSIDGHVVERLQSTLREAGRVPEKLLHSLEIAGIDTRMVRSLRPTAIGTVGASPAATAAWLEDRHGVPGGRRARTYLEQVVRRYGGPVPSVLPITTFERAWVVGNLKRIPLRSPRVRELAAALGDALTDRGAAGGQGLPLDADTTAGTLAALAKLGVRREVDCLWTFEVDTHFCTWHGERTASPTTNAHVLDAFRGRTSRSARTRARLEASRNKITSWLVGHQSAEGTWTDKWHASPYYATGSCVAALAYRTDEAATEAVERALTWILDTQGADGSWGRWHGTPEESAYAVRALAAVRDQGGHYGRNDAADSLARGRSYLRQSLGAVEDHPLWHDKDLYRPAAVVRAAILGALQIPDQPRHHRSPVAGTSGATSHRAH